MTKVITQETFDEAVEENIVEFEMNPEEAKEETAKQFEAQGVNLANIVRDLSLNPQTGKPYMTEAIENLKLHTPENRLQSEVVLRNLTKLHEECEKSLAHRLLVGKTLGHEVLLKVFDVELAENHERDMAVLAQLVQTETSLVAKQPDLFDAPSLRVIHTLIALQDEKLTILTMQWLQKVCVMHEANRQNVVNAGTVPLLKPFVQPGTSIPLLREVLTVLRYLVLDDDIRVEFGKAHEHARLIADEIVVELTKLLGEFQDPDLLADILLTMGTLAVRQEICKTIEESGGLKLLFEIMTGHKASVRINREALKLIRALAGNDSVKLEIIQQGGAPIIKDCLRKHQTNENIVAAVFGCISTLTLRVKNNSTAFFEAGVVELMVKTLRMHSKSKLVQRNGAWAIRNMVSRSRDQCPSWLSLGVEDLLNQSMKTHPSITQDIKSALRDLDCAVDLLEEWTGTAEKKIAAD